MLATKMLGEPHDAEPFELLTPAYRHYKYEFERYWHYYQVWGRVSYNPKRSPELWEREFARRFGPEAGPRVMEALHAASNVLPRIVAASYNYRYFPTTRGWAEMMRLGDLPEYAKGTGTDVEQFQSYRDAASELLAGEFTAKRTPFQTSQWFADVADQILADVDAASAAATDLQGTAAREFRATTTDLKILAYLARYHASRMKAAVWYNVYLQIQGSVCTGTLHCRRVAGHRPLEEDHRIRRRCLSRDAQVRRPPRRLQLALEGGIDEARRGPRRTPRNCRVKRASTRMCASVCCGRKLSSLADTLSIDVASSARPQHPAKI